MITPYFENIEIEIERNIYHAQNSICVAVAYFTSQTIFNALLDAAGKGKKVTLIISEDEANFQCGIVLHDLIRVGGTIHVAIKEGGMMHHKFCIIDGEKLLFGSYNWTGRAKNNLESICLINNDEACITAFKQQFEMLLADSMALQRPGELYRIPTGIKIFDDTFNGFGSGVLTIILGSSQNALTQLLLSLVRWILDNRDESWVNFSCGY